jgi:hypothetical protein
VQRGNVLEASDAGDNDQFGISISLSSDSKILAVGSLLWEGDTGTNRGGVYLYDWNGSSWVQRGNVLEASDAFDLDLFGISISLSSDSKILAVGSLLWEGDTGTDRGGVYLYDIDTTPPNTHQSFKISRERISLCFWYSNRQ